MKPKIGLFVAQPYCSTQSNNGIMAALSSHYDFKLFTKQEVENGFFETVDAICFGGGFGDSDSFRHLFVNNRDHIRKFVRSGRPYIGICMGGYWAGSHYFGILNACDTTQYITRPGTDTRRPHAKDLEVDWNGRRERMFFYDGFAVTGSEENFRTYARYMNGDPMAIIQDNVGLIGCHPEAEQFWYDSYTWMKGKYKPKQQLLLDFVNELMKSK